MLGLEIIKQTIQQNSSNGMSEILRKKKAIAKIKIYNYIWIRKRKLKS